MLTMSRFTFRCDTVKMVRIPSVPYHHGDLRNDLLAVAFDILKAKGPAGLSLREVAREAGVSHQAPYHHFPSRAHLLAALAAQGFDQLAAELDAVQIGTGDVESQGYETAVHYVMFAARHPERFKLMFGGELGPRTQYPQLDEAARRVFERLVRPLGAAIRPGAGNPPPVVLTSWAAMHGLAALVVDGQVRLEGQALEEAARQVATVLWVGIKRTVLESTSSVSPL